MFEVQTNNITIHLIFIYYNIYQQKAPPTYFFPFLNHTLEQMAHSKSKLQPHYYRYFCYTIYAYKNMKKTIVVQNITIKGGGIF